MKKFKPLYTFASLWKQFVMFTKNWRRKSTGELINKDKLELGDVTANDIEVRDIKCRKVTASGKIKTTGDLECKDISCEDIDAGDITGDSIIENMTGYSYSRESMDGNIHIDYAGVVKTGNKITFVQAGYILGSSAIPTGTAMQLGKFTIPNEVGSKLYNITETSNLDVRKILLYFIGSVSDSVDCLAWMSSDSQTTKTMIFKTTSTLSAEQKYAFRYECTFLLSDNMNI